MSLILRNENSISVDNIDNLLNLEQRNKNKYDMQDAVYNESKSNSDNNYDNSINKKDEIDSFILERAVNKILNSMSFYNNPVRDVLDNYEVDHEVECSKLSENIQNEPNIPFNSKYIKSESNVADIMIKVGPSKVNKFELEPELGESERYNIRLCHP